METITILIIDDEEDIRELVEWYLSREGYKVLTCDRGEKALELVRAQLPTLIVLDLMLPGINGLEVCRKLKTNPTTEPIPIVMLTAKGQDTDIVTGLELGAEDYVTKPFSGKVLVARIQRILRRTASDRGEPGVIQQEGLTIDPVRREVHRQEDLIPLTFTEFNILYLLAQRPGIVFTRYQIVDAVHGSDYAVTDRAIDVQMVSLRRKLGPAGAYIETVRGVGYRFKD